MEETDPPSTQFPSIKANRDIWYIQLKPTNVLFIPSQIYTLLARHRWLMTVILATWEAEIRRITV
jgi:hypothetical protein